MSFACGRRTARNRRMVERAAAVGSCPTLDFDSAPALGSRYMLVEMPYVVSSGSPLPGLRHRFFGGKMRAAIRRQPRREHAMGDGGRANKIPVAPRRSQRDQVTHGIPMAAVESS